MFQHEVQSQSKPVGGIGSDWTSLWQSSWGFVKDQATLAYTESIRRGIFTYSKKLKCEVMPWCRWSLAGHSAWRPVFDHRPASVGFMVGRVALGHIFFQLFQLCLAPVLSPMSHACYFMHLPSI